MELTMAEGSLPALQNILMELEKDPAFLKLELNNEDFFESCNGDSCNTKENHLKSKEIFLFSREEFKRALIPSSVIAELRLFGSDNSEINVEFLNLRNVYEKAQSRINRQSRQRIIKGKVDMVVTFDAQIQDIGVTVERIPEAKTLSGDKCGQVAIKVKVEKLELNKQYFSVDLDSVYLAQDGCTPVYKLSTVDAERRNRFHLAIVLVFIDGTQSKTFYSSPFLLRSKKKFRFRSIS